jgi:hypothetical protein
MSKLLLAGAATLITACGFFSLAHASGTAPKLSGTPAPSVNVGAFYRFHPHAADAEGDTLVFSIKSKPSWAYFNRGTGRLYGTPPVAAVGVHEGITISVTDGTSTRALPPFSITVNSTASTSPSTPTSTTPIPPPRKAGYGHYFATRYQDGPADVAMLCEQAGVKGVLMRRTWSQVEPTVGAYDFQAIDQTFAAIAASRNPGCQLWVMVEYKSFGPSPVRHPAPAYLARYQALNSEGVASSLMMWEPVVGDAYVRLMQALAARYDANPRFEGFVMQESALGFFGEYSQDVAAGGTYTADRWRDALVRYVGACGAAFKQSRCMAFMNFIRGGTEHMAAVSRAIAAVPNNRACMSGPDLLPDNKTLYDSRSAVYEVLTRHPGCRSNSAQNDSYAIWRYGLDQVFNFAVRGTFGDFDQTAPRASGVCVNSYLFWNHRVGRSYTGLNWLDALPVIAAYPYGRMWLDQCVGGGTAP